MSNHSLLQIRNIISRANQCYFYSNESPISDEEYDTLKRELKKLCPEDPLLSLVGAPVPADSVLQKVEHRHHMGSLNNAMNEEEFRIWHEKMADAWHGPSELRYNVSFKMDGASAELVYDDGVLVQASTRGDGCLEGSTLLEFEDGTKRSIQDIVTERIRGKVKCFDTATGAIVYREILEFFENGESEDWYEVSGVTTEGDTATLRITGAHLVWVPGKGYTEVRNLVKGDEVVFKA